LGDLDDLARAAPRCLSGAGRRGDQPVLDGEHRRSGARALTCFVVHARQVVLHGARGEKQALGDFAVGQAAGDEAQHLDLARAEIARPRGAGAREADGGEQRRAALGIQTPGDDLRFKLGCRVRQASCGAV
jgi:hypothetical protein